MLEKKCVGDKLKMLVTDLIHWKNHQHNGKSHQHNDSATNITVTDFTRQQNDKSTKTGLVDINKNLMITVLF